MLFSKDGIKVSKRKVILDFNKIRPLILKRYKNYEELCTSLNSCMHNTQWVLDSATESGYLIYKPYSRSTTLVPRLIRLLNINPNKYIVEVVK